MTLLLAAREWGPQTLRRSHQVRDSIVARETATQSFLLSEAPYLFISDFPVAASAYLEHACAPFLALFPADAIRKVE